MLTKSRKFDLIPSRETRDIMSLSQMREKEGNRPGARGDSTRGGHQKTLSKNYIEAPLPI